MAKFIYQGVDKEGAEITETVEALDKYAVYEIARTKGYVVQSVKEAKAFSFENFLNMEKLNLLFGRVSQDQLVTLTRNLASMIKAGLPLTRSLSVIERQTKNERLKQIVKTLQAEINKGNPFHDGLSRFPKVFSDLYVSMVRAGEESGKISETLQTLSLQLERSSTLKKKVKGAMMYPSIVVGVMVIIGILMMIYVVPSITSTFTKLNVDLPLSTQILIAISDTLSNHSILVIIAVVGIIIGVMAFFRTMFGKRVFHFTTVRLPVIGVLARELNAARTARTLSSLLQSGVNVIEAIKITEDVVQNLYYKDILADAAMRVEKGAPLSETFIQSKLYPPLFGEMVAVGEETGQISHMLEELAIFYENEIEQKTKDLSTIIEPILMVVIGSTVGFFALAMIAPIYSISDSL